MTEITDHIDAVIAAIKAEDQAVLKMTSFVDEIDPTTNLHGCGTSACIAGFSQIVSTSLEDLIEEDYVYIEIEGPRFGLSYSEAENLFFALGSPTIYLEEITKTMAIAALTDIRETGCFTGWDNYISIGG
jgi:hypothetical protein